MLTDKTVTDLLDAFSSPDPTPGGGSAAALAGALGTALFVMVAGLPKTKTGAPEERTALDAAHRDLRRLRATLVDLVDRDAAAYDLVVAAYRMPKATPGEKSARAAAIQHAMQVATDVPAQTLRACAQVMHAVRAVADFGNPSAKSDMAVGVQLLMTAMQGAMFNVEANIGSVKDPAFVARVDADLQSLRQDMSDSVRHVHQSAGIIDLMLQSARRGGPMNLHGPGTGQAPTPAQLMPLVAGGLLRLGAPEARRALEALAVSPNAAVRTAAAEALAHFPDGA